MIQRILFFFLLSGSALCTQAQNIGIGTSTPDSSALLDINSNSKGVLLPRVTWSQRNNISAPATGLMLTVTDTLQGLYINNGTRLVPSWERLTTEKTGWNTGGNRNISSDSDFIGTIDSVDLNFRVANYRAGLLSAKSGNTALGFKSLLNLKSGEYNTAIGHASLASDSSGSFNVAVGSFSLNQNTTGVNNTSIGLSSMERNTSGSYNTTQGANSLYNNTTGFENAAIGFYSLYQNTSGSGNSVLGNMSMLSNTVGYENTAIGSSVLQNNTTGYQNTAIGRGALNSMNTGARNTALGYHSDMFNNIENSTAIGANAYVFSSNSIVLGSIKNVNGATSNVHVGIGTTYPLFPLQIKSDEFSVLDIDGSNTLGTWINLENNSNGSSIWQLVTTGSSNGEGLGNFLIRDQASNTTRLIIKKTTGIIGIGTTTPDSSALLDISSTNRGFLPPRMNSTQRDAIGGPAAGLQIYNTDTKAVEVYNGTKWYTPVHYAGEHYGGGTVFYTYDNGLHGLIAAATDQSTGIKWHNSFDHNTGATGDGLLAGNMNTQFGVATQVLDNTGNFATKTAADYAFTENGISYGDWYLPSKYELNLLYLQRTLVGGFSTDTYWSSTESNSAGVWCQSFNGGGQNAAFKSLTYRVRCIRSF